MKIAGAHVEGSPFLVKAYNADKVKVTDINSGVVGKPVFFSSKLYNFLFYLSYTSLHFFCFRSTSHFHFSQC